MNKDRTVFFNGKKLFTSLSTNMYNIHMIEKTKTVIINNNSK